METSSVTDEQRERSKRAKRWLKTACNPSILRLLIQVGRVIFWITKIALELMK